MRQGDTPLLDQSLQEHQVAAGVLGSAEDSLGHGAGGVVHGDEQSQLGSPVLQPGVLAAIDLDQHPFLGHAPAPEPVLLGTAASGAAQAGPDQNAAHRGAAQVDALPLPQQFGEVGVVGACIAVAGQLHHGSGSRLGYGIVGPSAPVAMGQCSGAILAIGGEETFGVTLADSHDLGGLGDGKLVFQNAVEDLNPGLFLLVQRYIPHGDDIFADQLPGDRIVEHQQISGQRPRKIDCWRMSCRTCPSPFGCFPPPRLTAQEWCTDSLERGRYRLILPKDGVTEDAPLPPKGRLRLAAIHQADAHRPDHQLLPGPEPRLLLQARHRAAHGLPTIVPHLPISR